VVSKETTTFLEVITGVDEAVVKIGEVDEIMTVSMKAF
jgi:hypothetical protein